MNFPLISEYIKAIMSAEDNFEKLKNLRPVLNEDGQPFMSSGNFAVVFKMKDVQSEKLYAAKCFLKEQDKRDESYKLITEELNNVDSPYLTSVRYYEKELFVDSNTTQETEFPVLLMDWVEGTTLDKYLRDNIQDQYALEMLAYRFSQLALWLLPQPFAHGDLKPDNILVRDDGTLVLVDYDGMYVPAMKGQKARELGSPDFRHPQRTEDDFDEHIDDFPIVSILLSLKAISLNPQLLEEYGASDRLLFEEKDYRDLSQCFLLDSLRPMLIDCELQKLYALFLLLNSDFYHPFDIKLLRIKVVSYHQEQHLIPNSYSTNRFNVCLNEAKWGNYNAQYVVGLCYSNEWGTEKNYILATNWFKKAAEQGYAPAQFAFGNRLFNGDGIVQNKKEAAEWYRKAAEQGLVSAQYNIGICFFKGDGIVQDKEKAVKWFKMAAEQGHALAQNAFGNCLFNGDGIVQNKKEAAEWYRKAAEQDFASAQYNIGICFFKGDGIVQDKEKAVKWFKMAAEQGHAPAQFAFGNRLFNGDGIVQNKKEAVEWYRKAAEQGYEKAKQIIEQLN